jgi:hypothetical protein
MDLQIHPTQILELLFILVILAGLIRSAVGAAARRGGAKGGMRQYSEEHQMEWLGKKLPDGFSFRGTNLSEPDITSVMKGMLHGSEMVVFIACYSYRTTSGFRELAQTVVAFPNVRQLGSRQIPPTGDTNLYLEAAGAWLILYRSNVLVKREELSAWCEAMYALAQRLTGGEKVG